MEVNKVVNANYVKNENFMLFQNFERFLKKIFNLPTGKNIIKKKDQKESY